MNENILEIINLKKYYGELRGVENVTIKLKKGEVYGFIGPNGAGKSTTIRTVLTLLNKNNGKILFKGEELNKNNIKQKEMIGYLPSEINLYEDLTVKEILDFHENFYNKILAKRRKELVKKLKLDLNKKIEDLSLGNLKKLGIVLALIHEPKLLILDEPTSGLDPIMQNVFYELLLEEKNKGTTILYSTHVLSELTKICDKIGIIKDGVIIKEDTVENILKNNKTYLTIESNDIEKIKNELKLKIISESDFTIKFLNDKNINEIIKKISKYQLNKLLIEEVSIEDMFIEYYK